MKKILTQTLFLQLKAPFRGLGATLLLSLLSLSSCKKEITVDLPAHEEKIVVDGWIEQGKYPVVILTKNSAYFSDLDSLSMIDLIVTKAKVTVSDGTFSEILTLKKNDDYFPPYIYEGVDYRGKAGSTYYLTIKYYDYNLTAVTTIPEPVQLDSLWFEKPAEEEGFLLWGTFTDSPQSVDYYRLFTKRKSKDVSYVPTLMSSFSDKFFNGEQFSVAIYRGFDNLLEKQNNSYFDVSDTVTVKICTIDEAHYNFWNSFSNEVSNTGNPFAASGSVIKSNIEGGLGVWGGYGASYYTRKVSP